MNQTQLLQKCIDMLAEKYVPALSGAKVIAFHNCYEVWLVGGAAAFVVGSYKMLLYWLGCVALTKSLRRMEYYPADVIGVVYRSGVNAGVL